MDILPSPEKLSQVVVCVKVDGYGIRILLFPRESVSSFCHTPAFGHSSCQASQIGKIPRDTENLLEGGQGWGGEVHLPVFSGSVPSPAGSFGSHVLPPSPPPPPPREGRGDEMSREEIKTTATLLNRPWGKNNNST